MATARRQAGAAQPAAPPTMPRVQPPLDHLQILLQRFESLISSIVTLREETQMIPGIDEWPSLLNRYSNLLSHAYSINASLLSASPHFLSSQLTAFNKVLEAEARSANLYAGSVEGSSALFGGLLGDQGAAGDAGSDGVKATADGLPELTYRDTNNQLPSLVAHPVLPISEENLNFLGALLRTAPEPQILEQEMDLVAKYDELAAERRRQEAAEAEAAGNDRTATTLTDAEQLDEDIAQHDVLALRALRMFYHIQQAPDEEGNVLNPRDRLPREEDELEDEEGEEEDDDDDDEEMADAAESGLGEESTAARRRRIQRRKDAELNTWTADSVAAFINGRLPPSR